MPDSRPVQRHGLLLNEPIDVKLSGKSILLEFPHFSSCLHLTKASSGTVLRMCRFTVCDGLHPI